MNTFSLLGFNQIGWLGILLFGILIFFISRELLTWYWKTNRIIELLEKIEENTRPKNSVATVEPTEKKI